MQYNLTGPSTRQYPRFLLHTVPPVAAYPHTAARWISYKNDAHYAHFFLHIPTTGKLEPLLVV